MFKLYFNCTQLLMGHY